MELYESADKDDLPPPKEQPDSKIDWQERLVMAMYPPIRGVHPGRISPMDEAELSAQTKEFLSELGVHLLGFPGYSRSKDLCREQMVAEGFKDLPQLMKRIGSLDPSEGAVMMHALDKYLSDTGVHVLPTASEIDRVDRRGGSLPYRKWEFRKLDPTGAGRYCTSVEVDLQGNAVLARKRIGVGKPEVEISPTQGALEISIAVRALKAFRNFEEKDDQAAAKKEIIQCLDDAFKAEGGPGVARAMKILQERADLIWDKDNPFIDFVKGSALTMSAGRPVWVFSITARDQQRTLQIEYYPPRRAQK